MIGIIEIIIGVIVFLVSFVYGLIRIINNPRGYNFSANAFKRWLFFALLGVVGGLALIIFGIIALF